MNKKELEDLKSVCQKLESMGLHENAMIVGNAINKIVQLDEELVKTKMILNDERRKSVPR